MGFCRFAVKHLGRLTQKAPVATHVAYIMRDENYGPAQAHVRYMTRDAKTVQSRECVFHGKVATDSTAKLPSVPHESCH